MEKILFVTGTLAAPALTRVLEGMSPGFEWDVAVLPRKVAALHSTQYIARHIAPQGFHRVVIPGLADGDVEEIVGAHGVTAEKGPKDLRDLPQFFGLAARADYGAHTMQILAEIQDAPQRSVGEIVERARYFQKAGADVIDLGCLAGVPFPHLEEAIETLKGQGLRVSVDSFDEAELLRGSDAGADLLLSLSGSNLHLAPRIRCGVVLIKEKEETWEDFDRHYRALTETGLPLILDAVLDPINFGFAASLGRFLEMRRRYPEAEMMMGVGNLTELTDADPAGVNAMLSGFCSELDIGYLLTTEVIHWCRGAVKQLDAARQLMHYSKAMRVLPKNIEPRLLTSSDLRVYEYTLTELHEMQAGLIDRNYRVFVSEGAIVCFNARTFVQGRTAREVFEQLDLGADASHAFYLGKELTKAEIALTLGKSYVQDEALEWGYHTAR